MALQFGLLVPQGWRMDLVGITDPVEAYETMTRVAQEAEALGYDSVWLFDHFHTVPVPTQEVTFECWTSTAALARDTKRVRIGQMVTCNGYRNPALMAKMASTVDVLSHGRLEFGIGAVGMNTSTVPMDMTFLMPPNACAIYAREYRSSWQCGHRKRLCSRVNIIM